jgi:hypothetical protein
MSRDSLYALGWALVVLALAALVVDVALLLSCIIWPELWVG